MHFFSTFWAWLNQQLGTYISDNTARVAGALEPAIVTLATVYVMFWGYLHLTGRIEEPLILGLKRLIMIGAVLGVSLHLWLYNELIVDTFYQAPAELAAAVIGAPDPVQSIDSIWDQGGQVGGYLWSNGGFLNNDFGFYIAGVIVWIFMGLLCAYTMFLIALSHLALAILLALGPLFVPLLLFSGTRRLFEAWLVQLINYALITVLAIMACALLLQVVQTYAAQTVARGTAIMTVDALNLVLIAFIVFLFMRQIMPLASGLAGGAALSTFGSMSRAVSWSSRTGYALLRGGATAAAVTVAKDG